eukprot:Rmarinus@m.19946
MKPTKQRSNNKQTKKRSKSKKKKKKKKKSRILKTPTLGRRLNTSEHWVCALTVSTMSMYLMPIYFLSFFLFSLLLASRDFYSYHFLPLCLNVGRYSFFLFTQVPSLAS